MDFVSDGSGGIEEMLHREYGSRNISTYVTPTILVDNMEGATKIPSLRLGLVETGDEIDEVPLTLNMMMEWDEIGTLLVNVTSWSMNLRVSRNRGLKWGKRPFSITSTSTRWPVDEGSQFQLKWWL